MVFQKSETVELKIRKAEGKTHIISFLNKYGLNYGKISKRMAEMPSLAYFSLEKNFEY